MMTKTDTHTTPAHPSRMPGHWVLAQLGKRVLRPGGIELTRRMLAALDVGSDDRVVEFAPGMGATARLTLCRSPASYTAIERDEAAAETVRKYLTGPNHQCVLGSAEETGLEDRTYHVVYGEAMLSMQTPKRRTDIVAEAYRILGPGGRYGIHELRILPDDLDRQVRDDIENNLTQAIRHRTAPLTTPEWRELLTSQGFTVRDEALAPMHLLEPARLLSDEGLFGTLRFIKNLLFRRDARRRVMAMRAVFRKYDSHLGAIALVAVKP